MRPHYYDRCYYLAAVLFFYNQGEKKSILPEESSESAPEEDSRNLLGRLTVWLDGLEGYDDDLEIEFTPLTGEMERGSAELSFCKLGGILILW